MRKVINFMTLLKEVYFILDIHLPKPEVFCKVFNNNKSCIYVAEFTKLSRGTKYISIKYHHLRSFTQKNTIWIYYIETQEQTLEIFTNQINE